MKSTDNNINNPTSVKLLDTLGEARLPKARIVSQDFYDRLQTKDPDTLYQIDDPHDPKMYLGDILISFGKTCQYMLGITQRGQYMIYRVTSNNLYGSFITEICEYDNVQFALNKLYIYNKLGYHDEKVLSMYATILEYIDGNISIFDTIIGIISEVVSKDDPGIQTVISLATQYNGRNGRDLSEEFQYKLNLISSEPSIRAFNEIYNIFVKYDLFRKSDSDHADVVKAIPEILNTVRLSILYAI